MDILHFPVPGYVKKKQSMDASTASVFSLLFFALSPCSTNPDCKILQASDAFVVLWQAPIRLLLIALPPNVSPRKKKKMLHGVFATSNLGGWTMERCFDSNGKVFPAWCWTETWPRRESFSFFSFLPPSLFHLFLFYRFRCDICIFMVHAIIISTT